MRVSSQASHCFQFEQDFVGQWRCIPLCVRRKLDLIGLKLKLTHWLAMPQKQRQELVDWQDDATSLQRLRDHLRHLTKSMPEGMAKDLPVAINEAWQCLDVVPDQLKQAAALRSVELTNRAWADLRELERFALCKLARPGHDHHNLDAAFIEVLR